MYAEKYNSSQWHEHIRRVAFTRDLIQRLISEHGLTTMADLSCGDAEVTRTLTGLTHRHLRDISDEGKDILTLLDEMPHAVDLFVCTETIEHLEAPWTVIERIREKTKWLVLSCPNDEKDTSNWEHYWSFDTHDVLSMISDAGFSEANYHRLWEPGWNYDYQIWTAR
jgi:hypothetical protein